MSHLEISVVIPVYNAAPFVEKAALSALEQPQTAEVILVEDGSSDNSLEVCKKLEAAHEKVKLFTHPGNANKGAGASRTLAVKKAKYPLISFLDADDFFLPDRYEAEERIFNNTPDADGVYGALGFYFYSEEARKKYEQAGFSSLELSTVKEVIPPEDLKWVLLDVISGKGSFSIVTLTVKKSLIEKNGYFSDIRTQQDMVFLIQLAISGRLYSGSIDKAIGMRGAHENNRITGTLRAYHKHAAMYREIHKWAKKKVQPKAVISFLKARQLINELYAAESGFGRKLKFFQAVISCKFFLRYEYFFNSAVNKTFSEDTSRFLISNKERIQTRLFRSNSSRPAMDAALGVSAEE